MRTQRQRQPIQIDVHISKQISACEIFRLLGLFNPINRDNYRNQVNPHGEPPTILSLMSYDAQTTEADKAPYHTIYHSLPYQSIPYHLGPIEPAAPAGWPTEMLNILNHNILLT